MENESPEFQVTIERFLRLYDSHPIHGPINDTEFIRDAVMVFSLGALREPDELVFLDAYKKAARVIANELMRVPDRKTGLISFPSVFFDKDKMLTPAEMKRRAIAFDVWKMVNEGAPVTHAIARVATDKNFSPQKISKDYYDWKDGFEALDKIILKNTEDK